jgi:hypothetical protein
MESVLNGGSVSLESSASCQLSNEYMDGIIVTTLCYVLFIPSSFRHVT